MRKEKKQKSQVMKETMEALRRAIAAMSGSVRVAEQELSAPDISFPLVQ